MTGLSESEPTHVQRHHRHRLILAVTGAELYDGALYLRYEIDPAPDEFAWDTELHEGATGVGVAIDQHHRVFDDCSSAYRRSREGTHVVGVVRFRSLPIGEDLDVAVLFAPLAHTPRLHGHLCEARLRIESGQPRVVSVRTA
jgi:hypothetical protein